MFTWLRGHLNPLYAWQSVTWCFTQDGQMRPSWVHIQQTKQQTNHYIKDGQIIRDVMGFLYVWLRIRKN